MKTSVNIVGDRWATLDEMNMTGVQHVFGVSDKRIAGGGPILNWNGMSATLLPEKHTAILGGTGAGKTQSVLFPALLASIDQGESCIVNDPKGGELYCYTADYARKNGYKVVLLNYSDPCKSSRWNCFSLVEKLWKDGNQFASDQYLWDIALLIYEKYINDAKDPYWGQAASQYFFGLAQILRKEGYPITFESILNLHTKGRIKKGIEFTIKKWLDLFDPDNTIRQNLATSLDVPSDTRFCVDSVFQVPLRDYCTAGLGNAAASDSFDFAELGKEKCIVYLVTPPVRSTFDPLVSLFIKQAISVLTDRGIQKRPVTFFLEEFASFPKVSDFELAISMARSYNIRFIICAQSSEQLHAKYGDNADTIINNCGCLYILRSKDRKLYDQYVQPLCGTKVLPYSDRSYPLISFSDIQHFHCGQVLIMVDGLYPFVTQLPQVTELGVALKETYLSDYPSLTTIEIPRFYDIEKAIQEENSRRTVQAIRAAQEEREKQMREERQRKLSESRLRSEKSARNQNDCQRKYSESDSKRADVKSGTKESHPGTSISIQDTDEDDGRFEAMMFLELDEDEDDEGDDIDGEADSLDLEQISAEIDALLKESEKKNTEKSSKVESNEADTDK